MDSLSDVLAHMIVDIISLIVMFVAVRVGLFVLERVLKGVTSLPIVKQADKAGGFILGALEGLLTVYIVFAILIMFSASPKFQECLRQLKFHCRKSTVPQQFYSGLDVPERRHSVNMDGVNMIGSISGTINECYFKSIEIFNEKCFFLKHWTIKAL